jgi:hypothetical protein
VKSAVLTAIDNRAGVAPPTTVVPAGPADAEVIGAGLDAMGEAGALVAGEVDAAPDAALATGLGEDAKDAEDPGDGGGVGFGEVDGAA